APFRTSGSFWRLLSDHAPGSGRQALLFGGGEGREISGERGAFLWRERLGDGGHDGGVRPAAGHAQFGEKRKLTVEECLSLTSQSREIVPCALMVARKAGRDVTPRIALREQGFDGGGGTGPAAGAVQRRD